MLFEKRSFSSVILKTEFVHSKLVIAYNHLLSSKRFIVGEKEKVCVWACILISSVSCGFVFVCLMKLSVCFKLKVTIIDLSIPNPSSVLYPLMNFFIILWKFSVLFFRKSIILYRLWFTFSMLRNRLNLFALFDIFYAVINCYFP